MTLLYLILPNARLKIVIQYSSNYGGMFKVLYESLQIRYNIKDPWLYFLSQPLGYMV